jgi:fibronectin type 3 domain-containing protein
MFNRVVLRLGRTRPGSASASKERAAGRIESAIRSAVEPLERRVMLSASASLVKVDAATQGNWTGVYGADGYSIVGGSTTLPSYGTFSATGNQFYEWQVPGTYDVPAPTDPRDPSVRAGDTNRVAAADVASSSFSYGVTITDGNVHQVAFYLLDWDATGRSETVTVTDAASGTTLATTDVTSFLGGKYAVFDISGAVTVTISNDPGSPNAVASAIFFDAGPSTAGPVSTTPGTASLLKTDTATQGNWNGAYGTDGFNVIGGDTSVPSYATYTVSGGQYWQFYDWQLTGNWESPPPTDPRDPQVARGDTNRVAATEYDQNSITFNLSLNDGQTHQLALYLLDWDQQGRAETVTVSDATSGTPLSTTDVTGFQGGKYLVYDLSGHVKVTVSNDAGSTNAVVSGLFFDTPSSVSANSPLADGGFETPAVGSGNYGYAPSGAPWTFTPQSGTNGSGISANGSDLTSGNPGAPEGQQIAFLQGDGSISQAVVPGAGTYALSFWAAQQNNSPQSAQQDFEVLVDGSVVGRFTPPSAGVYTRYSTGSFPLASGPHTIEFLGLDSAGGNNTAFIDDVKLGAPPAWPAVPGSPSVLTTTIQAATVVDLTWTASSGSMTAYHVERSTDGGVHFTEIAGDVQGTEYLDTAANANTNYTYRVRAENDGTYSGYATGSQVTTPAPTPPAMPAGLSAKAYDGGIALAWSANTEPDLVGYNVARATSASGPFTNLLNTAGPLTSPAFNDTTAPAGVTVYYQVTAVNASDQSSAPAPASAVGPTTTAATPTGLTAAQVNAMSVLLTWSGPAGVTYNVYRDGSPMALGIASTAYLDLSQVEPNHTYQYQVESVSSSGARSPQTDPITVTTPADQSGLTAQTIDPPTNLQAVAGSRYQDGGAGSLYEDGPDDEITLTWDDSGSPGIIGYEIDRNGVQVGAVSTSFKIHTTFTDLHLAPNTTYQYSVYALASGTGRSAAATIPWATAPDQTPPNTPTDLHATSQTASAVSLAWVAPADNVGVVRYDIYRDEFSSSEKVGSSAVPQFTDNNPPDPASNTNGWFRYSVVAVDAAGNQSANSGFLVLYSVNGDPQTDVTSDQYIPSEWQDYFYNDLSPVAAEYLQFQSSRMYGTWDFSAVGTPISPPPIPYAAFDTIGITGQLCYKDESGENQYLPGDPVWFDVKGDSQFDPNDPVISNPNGLPLNPGDYGKKNGLLFLDSHGDGVWHSDDFVWAGPSGRLQFQQDVAWMYTAIDAAGWVSGDQFFQKAGAPATPGTGTITVSYDSTTSTYIATGSGTHFLSQLIPGNAVSIAGWGTSFVGAVESDTQFTLTSFQFGGQPGYPTNQPFSITGWTIIPNRSASGTTPALSLVQGVPNQYGLGLLFPEQFAELRNALMEMFPGVQIASPPPTRIPLTSEVIE